MGRTVFHRLVAKLAAIGAFNRMPDEQYLCLQYWAILDRRLNLKNPQTFNEKLQWLKLHNRRPEYTMMVDKYEVKNYIAERIGREYIIPTLGVWDRFEDIDFDMLPEQFVLKCTHDSGGLVIVHDKSKLDKTAARKTIERSLKKNYYLYGREWPYQNVKPRIIAEQYMSDSDDSEELTDYKCMCFHGRAEYVFAITERYSASGRKIIIYDREWKKQPFGRDKKVCVEDVERPCNLDKMIQLAEQLAEDVPFLRVDFYEVAGKLYFGELTFFPGSGMEAFHPEGWDRKLGEMIDLQRLN